MNGERRELLSQTDRRRRLMQHGAILGGILLLLPAAALVDVPGSFAFAIATMAGGLVLLGVAAAIKQRWEVSYKGHRIRVENNPILGEKLFIDDALAGRGKIGLRSELRGIIRDGDGAGDVIVALTVAGLLSFQCRIVAEPAGVPEVTAARTLSDQQLLEEVRRRGL
jgi:hypothetical protein